MWTRRKLTRANLQWLKRASPRAAWSTTTFAISHGTPIDEDAYIFGEIEALNVFRQPRFPICFFGHSHFPVIFALSPDAITTILTVAPSFRFRLREGVRYLINPGSIGQPRDGNPLASFAIYDSETRTVTIHRIPTALESTQQKILQGGPAPAAGRPAGDRPLGQPGQPQVDPDSREQAPTPAAPAARRRWTGSPRPTAMKRAPAPVHVIGPGLVHGLAGGHVPVDLGVRSSGAKITVVRSTPTRASSPSPGTLRSRPRGASREPHGASASRGRSTPACPARPVADHCGIRRQDREALSPRATSSALARANRSTAVLAVLAGAERLVHAGFHDAKGNAERVQDERAARRGRREHESGGSRRLTHGAPLSPAEREMTVATRVSAAVGPLTTNSSAPW